MADQEPKRGYPYLGASAWAELRRRLKSSIPKAIDREYLHTALGVSEKAAANLIPQLKTVGLIDDENKPTELVNDFRDDEHYRRACQQMVSRVYPEALLSAVDDPPQQFDAAVRWFMRQGTGEATAKAQAKFFVLLHNPTPPEVSDSPTKKAPKKAGTKSAPKPTEAQPIVDEQPSVDVVELPQQTAPPARESPSLHMDVHIHIAADTSPQQIDAIFESMAKHLYG